MLEKQSLTTLNALSPLDGRYQTKLDALRPYFSEFALIKHRAWVELEWLKALSAAPELAEIAPFSSETIAELDSAIAIRGCSMSTLPRCCAAENREF